MKATENKETGEKMHVYEVSFLIVPTVSEDSISEEFSAVKSAVESSGGSVITEEFPKKRNLAYTMEKAFESKYQRYDEAYFGWIKFELVSASVADIKAELDKRQTVLRHMIVKTVRENTMFTSNLDGSESDGSEEGSEGSSDMGGEESSAKETDKSVDALVTN